MKYELSPTQNRHPPSPRLLLSCALNKTISPPEKSRKNLRIRREKAETSQTINKRPQLFIRRKNRVLRVQTDPSRVFTQPGPAPLALSDKAHVYEKNYFKTTRECKYQSGLGSCMLKTLARPRLYSPVPARKIEASFYYQHRFIGLNCKGNLKKKTQFRKD